MTPNSPTLTAERLAQIEALRTDVGRKLAAYRQRNDQSATILFQHLSYLRFDAIIDESEELQAAYSALTTQLQEAEAARVTGIQGVLREWRDEELARAEEDLSGSLRWEVQDLMHQSFDLKSRELTGQPLPAEAVPLPDLPAPPHQEEGEKEVGND